MKSLSRIFAILLKEVRQLRRDRLTFGMVVGLPVMQMLLFGYAINTDVRNLKTAIADQADTHLSRQFVAELAQTQVVDIVGGVNSPRQLEALLREGSISIGVHIPHDFDRRIVDRTRAASHLLVDGSDPTILGVANQLRAMPFGFDAGDAGPAAQVIEVRPYYNPERRTPVNIVPGLMGVILTMTMILFTAVAIVRERERGNLELLINTPVSSAELMIGKVVPYILIGMLQLALILAVGRLLFDVPVRGSIVDLYLAAFAFIAANLALGLFISTAARTQFQAMQMTIFIFLPSILLSGFMFPFEGMPLVAQWLGEVLPNTHFIRLTRGIMLRGASIGDLYRDVGYLLGFALVAMTGAALRFTKRLD
ncbi:MAG: ABC transporter permease [Gammaproteobacteria bacterium]|jgi:ABC-2 type transport system permease protein|nr:ABC transporter permease [Gammaproteobacteria bacterium]MDH3847797.1 ABC transporter permease [Gammaproteobacteria bacterium]MDH3862501.1 ABC transporter permease [Gammaproteobacteria bacterium]MDH3904629.1 ABC transporter permease [Gammaproteobacteria bacterium]NCF58546.1 ABC transporter permease [Gammaproteobacteria bacterium]